MSCDYMHKVVDNGIEAPLCQKFQTWKIPSGGGTVRNMMPTKDGNLALAESGENMVALVEVK